jgi:hypothetical protein
MGSQGFTAVQLMQIVGDHGVRVIPEIMVGGGQGGGGTVIDALLGVILRDQLARNAHPIGNGANPAPSSESVERK